MAGTARLRQRWLGLVGVPGVPGATGGYPRAEAHARPRRRRPRSTTALAPTALAPTALAPTTLATAALATAALATAALATVALVTAVLATAALATAALAAAALATSALATAALANAALMAGACTMDAFMAVSGWEEDEGVNDDVTNAVVATAHVATLLAARRRALAAARVHRPRYRGSVPGRLPNRPRILSLACSASFVITLALTACPLFSVDSSLSGDFACRCRPSCGSTVQSRTARLRRNG